MYERGSTISKEVIKSLLLEGQGEIRNCMVYSEKESCPVYGTRVSMIQAARAETWFSYYNGCCGQWFFYPNAGSHEKSIASLVYGIEKVDVNSFGREELGIVKLDVQMERLFAPANHSGEGRNFDVLVYDDEGRFWYVSDETKTTLFHQYSDFSRTKKEKRKV